MCSFLDFISIVYLSFLMRKIKVHVGWNISQQELFFLALEDSKKNNESSEKLTNSCLADLYLLKHVGLDTWILIAKKKKYSLLIARETEKPNLEENSICNYIIRFFKNLANDLILKA